MKHLNCWRIFSLLLLIALGAVGFAIWSEREVLSERLFNRKTVVPFNLQSFVIRSQFMINEFNAEVAILWRTDLLHSNTREAVVVLTKNGQDDELEGSRTSLFSDKDQGINTTTIRLINGEVFCSEVNSQSTFGQTLLRQGVTINCRAPIISKENLLLGFVSVGFKSADHVRDIQAITDALKRIAEEVPAVVPP